MKIICRYLVTGPLLKEDKFALLNGGIQVVVGTPRKVLDFVQRKRLKL